MRKSQPSSDLLAKQRYCITTGSSSCCSGGTGPVGPTGPAGADICVGDVYIGVVSTNTPPPVGPAGTFAFQMNGTVLLESNGTTWVTLSVSPYYFIDATNTSTIYYVDDASPTPSTDIACGIIFSPWNNTIYSRGLGWTNQGTIRGATGPTGANGYSTNTGATGPIGATGPVHAGSSSVNSSITMTGGVSTQLITHSITPSIIGGSVYASTTLHLQSGTDSSEGELYLSVNGATGMSFPYTTSASRPTTHAISQLFTGVAGGAPINVILFGQNTSGITATGSGVLSVMYNML